MIKRLISILILIGACFASSDVPEFHQGKVSAFFEKFHIQPETKMELQRGGMSTSVIYKLEPYVIRLLFPNVPKEQRYRELVFHKAFEHMGFVPKIFYVDSESDPYMVVMEYIKGRNFDPNLDSQSTEILEQIASNLRTIHGSGLNFKDNNTLIDQIRGFQYDLSRLPSDFEKWRKDLLNESKKYQSFPMVPVHGDLSRWNIIISEAGKVYFIDFQEARMDSIYSEIGYFFYESGIDDLEVIKNFLEIYLGKRATEEDLAAIDFYMGATAFACGIYLLNWIDQKYTTRDLDEMLKEITSRGIDSYKGKHYDKIELAMMTSEQKAKFVLGFFKDFVQRSSKVLTEGTGIGS